MLSTQKQHILVLFFSPLTKYYRQSMYEPFYFSLSVPSESKFNLNSPSPHSQYYYLRLYLFSSMLFYTPEHLRAIYKMRDDLWCVSHWLILWVLDKEFLWISFYFQAPYSIPHDLSLSTIAIQNMIALSHYGWLQRRQDSCSNE